MKYIFLNPYSDWAKCYACRERKACYLAIRSVECVENLCTLSADGVFRCVETILRRNPSKGHYAFCADCTLGLPEYRVTPDSLQILIAQGLLKHKTQYVLHQLAENFVQRDMMPCLDFIMALPEFDVNYCQRIFLSKRKMHNLGIFLAKVHRVDLLPKLWLRSYNLTYTLIPDLLEASDITSDIRTQILDMIDFVEHGFDIGRMLMSKLASMNNQTGVVDTLRECMSRGFKPDVKHFSKVQFLELEVLFFLQASGLDVWNHALPLIIGSLQQDRIDVFDEIISKSPLPKHIIVNAVLNYYRRNATINTSVVRQMLAYGCDLMSIAPFLELFFLRCVTIHDYVLAQEICTIYPEIVHVDLAKIAIYILLQRLKSGSDYYDFLDFLAAKMNSTIGENSIWMFVAILHTDNVTDFRELMCHYHFDPNRSVSAADGIIAVRPLLGRRFRLGNIAIKWPDDTIQDYTLMDVAIFDKSCTEFITQLVHLGAMFDLAKIHQMLQPYRYKTEYNSNMRALCQARYINQTIEFINQTYHLEIEFEPYQRLDITVEYFGSLHEHRCLDISKLEFSKSGSTNNKRSSRKKH